MRGRTMAHISKNASIVYRSSQAFFDETLAPYHIGCGQQFFLMRIYEQPGISQFELAETGSFDKGTCARAVKKLEELGYLRRETRSSDRRSVQLYLTGQGEQLVPVIQDMLLEWNAILCRTLQADEKEQAERLLDEIAGNAAAYIKR